MVERIVPRRFLGKYLPPILMSFLGKFELFVGGGGDEGEEGRGGGGKVSCREEGGRRRKEEERDG